MEAKQKTASRSQVRNNTHVAVAGARAHRHEVFERIYQEWDAALSGGDVEELLALYAADAVLESPLVSYLMNQEVGICRGHDELRPLFEMLRQRKPPVRQHYRTGYFTNGKKLIWEYPRVTPKGEQMDFVEVMEINNDGLIQHHSVYWGWFGMRVLQRNEYHKVGQRPDDTPHRNGAAAKNG
jgi:ketosteroid isomerase-like protein